MEKYELNIVLEEEAKRCTSWHGDSSRILRYGQGFDSRRRQKSKKL